jgi:prevent-host-death family protein
MRTVNMHEAKTSLSCLVDSVESGAETEIVIARNGRPAAKLVALSARSQPGKRIGLLEGQFPPMSLEDFDADNELIAAMFRGVNP